MARYQADERYQAALSACAARDLKAAKVEIDASIERRAASQSRRVSRRCPGLFSPGSEGSG